MTSWDERKEPGTMLPTDGRRVVLCQCRKNWTLKGTLCTACSRKAGKS